MIWRIYQLTATSGTITYTNAGTADTGAAIAAKAISISATDTLTIDENVTASAGALTRATTVAGKNLAFTGANTISGTGGVVTLRSDGHEPGRHGGDRGGWCEHQRVHDVRGAGDIAGRGGRGQAVPGTGRGAGAGFPRAW